MSITCPQIVVAPQWNLKFPLVLLPEYILKGCFIQLIDHLEADLTAANFGKLSDIATKDDMALGIMNLVFETVGMVSIFAARSVGVKDIILTGNVTRLAHCRCKFEEFNRLEVGRGLNFVIPQRSRFSTAIGAAVIGMRRDED